VRNFFKNKLFIFFFLIFFIPAFFTISDYNVNWDEPEHFRRGQAIVHYFLTRETNYKNLPFYDKFKALQAQNNLPENFTPRYSLFQNSILNGDYYLQKDDGGHPPLAGILATISNYVLYQNLGVLGDVDSYHLMIVLGAALLVFLISAWVYSEYGLFASFVSVLSLSLTPLFFAESHVNIKDPLEATFFALTIYTFYKGITKEKKLHILLSSVFFGMAFATKFNVLFLPFIMLPWLILYYGKNILRLKKVIIALIPYPFISFSIFFLSWPFLWFNFPKRILSIFGYYKTMGTSDVYTQPLSFYFMGFNTYPLQTILYTTPLIILFLSFFGIVYVFAKGFKEKNKTSFLIFLWLIIPILRVTMPGTSIYGGVRQIMEFIPAMAILSGIGAKYFADQVLSIMYKVLSIKSKYKKTFMLYALYFILILSFLPITFKLISIHPNENVYFNPLIGGLKGASEKNFPYWGLSLGSSYNQAVDWLNKNAEENSSVALVLGTGANIPRTSFRKDLVFDNGAWSGTQRKGEYLIEAVFNGWIREWYHAGEYVDRVLKPVYEAKVDDVAILKVWKNDSQHTYPKFLKEANLDPQDLKWQQDGNILSIETTNILELMSVSITVQNEECFDFKTGRTFLSLDNNRWDMEGEPIRGMYRVGNKLIYPFAAKKGKFIRMEIDKTSCPFTIEDVGISYIQT